jgi:hypothetical protein
MKPFFDSLNAAMSPADFHAIRRAAEALKLAAGAELAKVSPLDTPDSVSKLWDDLSDFLAGFDAENEPKGTSTEHLWATTERRP